MKRLPIGIEDFKELIDKDCYYVDKTSFITDIINEKVALYTRPRRFGKTLNMSMLYYFFSMKQKDNAYLFNDMDIVNHTDSLQYQISIRSFYYSERYEKTRLKKSKGDVRYPNPGYCQKKSGVTRK